MVWRWSSVGNLSQAAHGFPLEFEPVGVVDETIEDGIGVGRIADEIEPARYG